MITISNIEKEETELEKANRALEKMKKLEAKYKDSLKTFTAKNGCKVYCTNDGDLEDYKDYIGNSKYLNKIKLKTKKDESKG